MNLFSEQKQIHRLYLLIFCLFFFFFRATPGAYGSSQARNLIGAVAASLQHSHSNTRAKPSATYTTAHGNAGSLTGAGMVVATSSWILVRFVTNETQQELPDS